MLRSSHQVSFCIYNTHTLIPNTVLTRTDFPEFTRPATPTAVYLASSSRRLCTISAHFNQRAIRGRWERATSDKVVSLKSLPHLVVRLPRLIESSILHSLQSYDNVLFIFECFHDQQDAQWREKASRKYQTRSSQNGRNVFLSFFFFLLQTG